ncbi:MAG: hypothetical protein KDB53_07410 [Planctomycetes bacterium]|nr:hypothetical protein [Planctomycetota bacterium]
MTVEIRSSIPQALPPSATSPTPSTPAPDASRSGATAIDAAPVTVAPESSFLGASSQVSAPPLRIDPASPPPANEADLPVGLGHFRYGSGDVPLVETPPEAVHLKGGIGTPPEVAQLADWGVANAFSPEWQAFLDYAVRANGGGLGDAETGYLAFSREYGFVRFDHPGLTPEQNRRIAAISLQTGWPIERLPGRNLDDNSFESEKVDAWVNDFIGRFDEEMGAFLADPADDLKMQSGSRNHYQLKYDPEHNRVFSSEWRKNGGFRGMVEDNFDVIGPVLDGLTILTTAAGMPYLAAGIQTAKQGLVTAVTGDFEFEQGVAIATSWLGGPLKTTQLGQLLASPVGQAGVKLGTDLADDGRIEAATVAGIFTPELLRDLPGGPVVDEALQRGALVLARSIDGQEVGLADLYHVLEPFVAGLARGDDTAALGEQLRRAGIAGDPTGQESWYGLLSMVTDDPADIQLISGGFAVLADYLDQGKVDSKQVFGLLKDYFKDDIDRLKEDLRQELEDFLGLRQAS